MNPSIDKRIIDEAYEDDPESAKWNTAANSAPIWPISSHARRSTPWSAGRCELPPEPGVAYSGFVDPSGGVSDSMTLAIGHLGRNNACILDAAVEIRAAARFGTNGGRVRRVVAPLWRLDNRRRQIRRRRGRALASPSTASNSSTAARPKSRDLYRDLLPLLNARRVELLDLPRLSAQLCGLERRTARSGRDSIDHAPGGHDDLANAVAGALVGVDLDRRQPLVRLSDVFAADGLAPPLPRHCDIAFAVVAMAGADVAVVFAGHDRFKPMLHILDVVAGPLWRDFFNDTATRLQDLKRTCTA